MTVRQNIVCLVLSMIMSCALLAFASSSQATEPTPNPGGPLETSTGENCRSKYPGKLLAVIVPCVREEIMNTTIAMNEAFSQIMQAPAYAFLTLVITLFGVKVIMNEQDPKKDAFILLLKIGVVLLFLDSFGGFIPAIFGTVQEGIAITSSTLDQGTIQCDDIEGEMPWSYIDCLLGKLMGFAGDKGFVGASTLGLVGSAIWSGQFGAVFFMAVVAGFFFVFKLIIRATYVYLMATVVLGFLVFISPLMIPLVWMPATQQYFDRFQNACISVVVMPAIVMGYLTLAFAMLDKVMFDEDIGVATLLDEDTVKSMRRGRESANAQLNAANAERTNQATGENFDISQCGAPDQFEPMVPYLACAGNKNEANQLYSIDFSVDFRQGEAGLAGQIFFAFIALVLTAWLLDMMLGQLIQLCQLMLGGGYFMQTAVDDNPLESGLTNAQAQMGRSLSQTMANNDSAAGRAAAFGGNLASSMLSAPGNFVRGMSR